VTLWGATRNASAGGARGHIVSVSFERMLLFWRTCYYINNSQYIPNTEIMAIAIMLTKFGAASSCVSSRHVASLSEGGDERVGARLNFSKERLGGVLVLLSDREVKLFEILVERLGSLGITTLGIDEVVNVEAESTDLAAKFIGRLRPVLLTDVITNILVDAGLRFSKFICQSFVHAYGYQISRACSRRVTYHRLLGARRSFLRRELLEGESGRAIRARLGINVQIAGLRHLNHRQSSIVVQSSR